MIALCARQGKAEAIAQVLGASRPTLYKWNNRLLGCEVHASMKRQHPPSDDADKARLEREIA